MKLPSISSLFPILFDDKQCSLFLRDSGVFYNMLSCRVCGEDMRPNNRSGEFTCRKRSCNVHLSARVHTFFYGSHLKSCKIMHLAYLWLNRNTQTQAMNESGCSSNTVTAFYSHFRSLVATTLDDEDAQIGGPGVIVEIDETKLGKRKYNRGHRVDGVWILVGVEKIDVRKVFMRRIENRSQTTLNSIIHKYVLPGSIVYTDMWKGYTGLASSLGLDHQTVNHSICFKDLILGVNTQSKGLIT